jgi:hypothetical protein
MWPSSKCRIIDATPSLTMQRKHLMALALALAADVERQTGLSAGETAADLVPAIGQVARREPIVGVGFHPGNFVGPLAFDVILRSRRHIAIDLQVGTWSVDSDVRALGIAPQLQWEFVHGWQTPYTGLAFRYEEVWSNGMSASSKGGFLVGGWQWRWQSGLGVIIGGGLLYKNSVALNGTRAAYWGSGGLYGTYEVGLRCFF